MALQMPNTIQLGEYSMGSGRKANGRHSIRNRNSDDNLYVRYLYWNDGRWNWNYNWLDNDWNGNNPAAVPAIRLTSRPALKRG